MVDTRRGGTTRFPGGRRRTCTAATIATTALILAGCGTAVDSPAGAPTSSDTPEVVFNLSGKTLRMSASAPGSLTAGSRFVFDRLRQWGAEVDIIELSTTSGIREVLSDRADAGTHGADEAIVGESESADVVAIGSPTSRMDYVLVTKSGIDSVADLKGATIAMSGPDGFNTMLTRLLMRKEGLDPNSDARFVQIGGSPERAAALLAGTVDAATLHVEDWFEIRSRTDGLTSIITVGEVLPELPSDVYFGLRSFWEANEDLATALACANLEANAQFAQDRQGYIDFVMPIVDGATAQGVGDAWDFAMAEQMWPTDPAEILNPAGFQELADTMLEAGELDAPVDATTIVDLRYLEKAAALGCGQA